MRRLIKIFILSVVSFTLFQPLLSGQVEVDTIDIKETVLEERHLRYMYNFALNAALFQYEGGGILVHRPTFHQFYEGDDIVQVLIEEKSVVVSNLEAFVFPAEFCYLKYLKGAHQMAIQFPLKSQYHIEYLPPLEVNDTETKLEKIQKIIEEHEKSIIAVELSGLYNNRNRFYLEMEVYLYFNHQLRSDIVTFYFEYEWCESRRIVYPIRTNKNHIPQVEGVWTPHPHSEIKGYQRRHSPTIEIPALPCPILK